MWTQWFEHSGDGCPVPNGTLVHAIYDSGFDIVAQVTANGRPDEKNPWIWSDENSSIIRYRVRKPRALLNLIEMVENLPARQREDA